MPEGPEIKRAADRLAKVLVGKRLVQVNFGLERLETFEKELTNTRIKRMETRGKGLLTFFDNGKVMFTHNQLYGKWITCTVDAIPVSNRQVRVALYTKTHVAILYSASDIEVVDENDLNSIPFLSRLGPDVLDDQLKREAVLKRLSDQRFAGRSISSLLLDQSFFAGIGNYLRSEILFEAGLTPFKRLKDLRAEQKTKLADAILSISRRAYRDSGNCIKRGLRDTIKNSSNELVARGDPRYMVFDRQGLACRLCENKIEKTTLAGRRLYYCPDHQHD